MGKSGRIKKVQCLLVSGFCLFWALGCSTFSVKTDFDPEVEFSRYKTYAWMPQTMKDEGQMADLRKELGSWVESEVGWELDARGFTRKTEGKPDFFLTYYGQLEEVIQANTVSSAGCGSRGCGGSAVHRYIKGTLVLDMIDAETNEVVWRGTSVGPIDDPDKRRERVQQRVQAMLKDFPPK